MMSYMKESIRQNGFVILVLGIMLIPLFFYIGYTKLLYIPTNLHIAKNVQKPSTSFQDIEQLWPKKVPILMYHYVEYVQDKNDTIRQSLAISPSTFEKQMETLVNGGYTFLTASELGTIFNGEKALPNRSILITFDDGYRDFYTDVYPILKKYSIKATVYMIAGDIGYKNYMTEKQLQNIASEGLVEIGAHTIHHVNLQTATEPVMKNELVEGRNIIEEVIDKPVISFAYPDGQFSELSEQKVKEAGYTTAMTTKPGIMITSNLDRYALSRIRTGNATGTDLLKRINTIPVAMY